ncbi:multisubunit sodium/proton antiporter, MrpE subunit [Halorientalis regularis]|uniref:Multisubunit sodium/proton antiporter, MrpE subunit n=1 Tax=Halorientalis regularis TaxID=660518 RepID=A0A1G7PFS3_9EURY|nr:multisubunit sodium/proton antiporter, MrpE subunit [Halorientalis regularis]
MALIRTCHGHHDNSDCCQLSSGRVRPVGGPAARDFGGPTVTGEKLLVPVSESPTLRNTVAYAVRNAVEGENRYDAVHFVYPASRRIAGEEYIESARELLERVEVWAGEDLGEDDPEIAVETALIGVDAYLFSPGDYVELLVDYADANGIESVLLDPEFNPGENTPLLPPLESELERAGLSVETAPVERGTRRARLVRRAGLGQFVLLAGLSFAFYLLIGGSLAVFDLVTGAISAAIVATVLWRISLTGPVRPGRLVARLGRMLVFTPYLLWEIVVANLHVAYVVLHPSLPIDPELVEFDAAVWSEIPVTTLANSITLTPGTLTVDVTRQHFTVHTLTESSREDLLDGGLERAVRFVFYGRAAARGPGPRERGDDGGEES